MASLTDRYVQATLRELPGADRAATDRDLRSRIRSEIDERVANGAAPEQAERDVLAELGDPMRLAATYSGRPLALIGPDAYPSWRRLVVLLLGIVVPILMVLVGVAGLADGDSQGSVVADVVSAGFGVAVQVVFWVTLVFAIMDRQGVFDPNSQKPVGQWSLDQLPQAGDLAPSRGETVSEVVFTVMLIVFFPVQHFWLTVGNDEPILEPGLWRFWIPLLIVLALLSLVRAIVVAARRVTLWRDVGTVAVLSGLMTGALVWLALEDRLLNPAYVAHYEWLGEHIDSINLVIAITAIVVWVIEVAEATAQARRAQAARP